jgi:uncharacterized protein DUF3293
VTESAADSHDRINALLTLYRESHYDVDMPRSGTATLRIGEAAPPAVKRWIGGDGVAFYVTACNPRSHSLPREDNEQRLETLRAEMRERGCRWLEGAGHIPGEAWREQCLLVVGIDDKDVADLARRHEQNSIVVVPAKAPVALRIYRPDWHAVAGERADVEWA